MEEAQEISFSKEFSPNMWDLPSTTQVHRDRERERGKEGKEMCESEREMPAAE